MGRECINVRCYKKKMCRLAPVRENVYQNVLPVATFIRRSEIAGSAKSKRSGGREFDYFLSVLVKVTYAIFFCYSSNRDKCVSAVDTTFKLCDMWVTDTPYRNKKLVRYRAGKHPVLLRPTMFHFTKNEATFRRFCSEFLAANLDIDRVSHI